MRRLFPISLLLITFLTPGHLKSQDKPEPPADRDRQSGGYYVNIPVDSSRTQNPTVALFKSMFVPGWGQLGNKKYIKAGIFMALEGSLVVTLIHYSQKTSDAREKFDAAANTTVKEYYFNKFLEAKNERNRFSWYLGTTIFLSMFDAYVDAHLAKFPQYEKRISFDLAPHPDGGIAANLQLNF
ncbi:MAG: hypothetical protein HRF51_00850 [bacterium]